MGGRPAARGHRASLELEQPALRVETPGIAAERPIARDDPVAGDHDRDRVVPDRPGRRPVGAVVAGVVRDNAGNDRAYRAAAGADRKSTRLNSSHTVSSY